MAASPKYDSFDPVEHVEDTPETAPDVMVVHPPTQVEVPLPDDPWAHRAQKMRCATCMWWVRKDTAALGRCRRHAPTLSGYPATYDTDWCGDHKMDETKL